MQLLPQRLFTESLAFNATIRQQQKRWPLDPSQPSSVALCSISSNTKESRVKVCSTGMRLSQVAIHQTMPGAPQDQQKHPSQSTRGAHSNIPQPSLATLPNRWLRRSHRILFFVLSPQAPHFKFDQDWCFRFLQRIICGLNISRNEGNGITFLTPLIFLLRICWERPESFLFCTQRVINELIYGCTRTRLVQDSPCANIQDKNTSPDYTLLLIPSATAEGGGLPTMSQNHPTLFDLKEKEPFKCPTTPKFLVRKPGVRLWCSGVEESHSVAPEAGRGLRHGRQSTGNLIPTIFKA